MHRKTTLGAICIGAAALITWLVFEATQVPRVDRGVAGPVVAGRTAATPEANEPSTGEAVREPYSQKCLLRLTIRDRSGKPLAGTVYLRTGSSRCATSDMLAPDLGYTLAADVRVMQFDEGALECPIPEGHWTWLRATGLGATPCATYRCLLPFSGVRSEVLTLDRESRRLHAFVLRSDYAGAAASCEVALYRNDLRTGGPLKALGTVRADELGYCQFSELSAGAYLLTAGSARPGDPPPFAQRVVMPADALYSEIPCTLVEPPERIAMTIEVGARIDKRVGRAMLPRIFFVPLSGESDVVVAPATIGANEQTFEVMLPPGDHECRVLPIGDLRIENPVVRVAREGPHRHRITAVDTAAVTELDLGLDRADLPVQVYPRPVGAMLQGSEDEMFTGDYRWYASKRMVRSTDTRPARLVVSKLHRFWLSAEPVVLAGGSASVRLVPAARLEIEVPMEGKALSASVAAVIEYAGETLLLRPARRLAWRGGRMVPVLGGAAVVPMGPVRVTGLDQQSGQQLWERSLTTQRAREVVSGD